MYASYHGFTPRKLDRGEVSSGMLQDYRAKTGRKMYNLDFFNEEADNEGLDRFADWGRFRIIQLYGWLDHNFQWIDEIFVKQYDFDLGENNEQEITM